MTAERVELTPIGGVQLPKDLVAPFGGDCCGGEIWMATIEQVSLAAMGVAPLISECCGRRFAVKDIGRVTFFSRAEFDAAPDEGPHGCQPYVVGYAFRLPPDGR
jgi:hypothetical protein